ncbi:MAG: hypothetical protein EON59_06435 [Alphaproteobacteria bacterium]|nr:MAG: hypothetical protein EON59_06435 [Alphaproteobacteria bacterium]
MENEEFQLERCHLEWPDPASGVTITHHRAAWDRLRQVCRELGCEVPSLEDIESMAGLPPSFVVAADVNTGKPHLINFDIGYRASTKPHTV